MFIIGCLMYIIGAILFFGGIIVTLSGFAPAIFLTVFSGIFFAIANAIGENIPKATLQKQNPKEFDRIVYGKPVGRHMDRFFDSVLSMFTPEVTSKSSRLKERQSAIM